MYSVRYGGKQGPEYNLDLVEDLMVVRTRSYRPLSEADWSAPARRLIDQLVPVLAFADAGVEVRRHAARPPGAALDEMRAALRGEPDCRFAGRVLCDPASRAPVVYTENLFVKFADDEEGDACRAVLG